MARFEFKAFVAVDADDERAAKAAIDRFLEHPSVSDQAFTVGDVTVSLDDGSAEQVEGIE